MNWSQEDQVRRHRGVFNTNQINRDNMICPASELMRAEERLQRDCLARGIAPGTPTNISHDMHRLIGWTRPLGLYIDGRMVRVVGAIDEAVTDEEKTELRARGDAYWTAHHNEGTAPFRDDLIARLNSIELSQAEFIMLEAAAIRRAGLAAGIYPDLFTPNGGSVDKDGLVDYRELSARMKEIQPGVFHDSKRDLLLFAHRFYRRSLSHRNKLNSYFLNSFSEVAKENQTLRVRLRLDPDLVGHPSSLKNLIELEYWRGPHFNDDISSIPSGVTEHKADEQSRFYEGVDRTQVWWKSPESRKIDDGSFDYRTFEIEELIENPSGGLADNYFGCRYAHAEFSVSDGTISHFDGAIRAYAGEPYLDRIDASIDRAGKHANYTKLFRFDGDMTVAAWKRLLSDFFHGNKLIQEYLGAPDESDDREDIKEKPSNESPPHLETPDLELAALVSLEPGTIHAPVEILAEQVQQIGDAFIPFVEVGTGEIARYLRARFHLTDTSTVEFADDILNLPRIAIGASSQIKAIFDKEVAGITDALRQDISADVIRRLAVSFAWSSNGIVLTLSIAGKAEHVLTALENLSPVVDPTNPPSDWIEPLSDLIKTVSRPNQSEVHWSGINRGVLAIPRHGTIAIKMSIPKPLEEQLMLDGVIKATGNDKASTA